MRPAPDALPIGGPPRRSPAAVVTVPLHNNARYVGDLLESLFRQWRPDLELVMIDDRSTDGGLQQVEAILARHPRVRATVMRTEKAEGAGLVARILRLSKAKIVIRADSDDLALPGRLQATMAYFEGDASCRIVTSNALLVSPESRTLGVYNTLSSGGVSRDLLTAAAARGDERWLGATMAYHRDVYDRFPPFDPELCPYGLDMLLPFRALLLGSHHYIAEPLVGWRQHGGNTHRRLGSSDESDAGQENYRALHMMILAQKMRDVAFFAQQAPSPLLDRALIRCRTRFDAEFADWCRARTRLLAQREPRPGPARPPYQPGVPPLPTLVVGDSLLFSDGEPGAEVLSHRPGFHRPESWGTWTERSAHLSLRVVSSPASAVSLRLRLISPQLIPRQRVRIQVGSGRWTEVEVAAGQPCDVELHCDEVCETRIVDIVLLMPGAVLLTKDDPSQADARVIGIGIIAISAVRALSSDHGEITDPASTADGEPSGGLAEARS